MIEATRVEDRPGWAPVTQHYAIPGGWLAVTRLEYFTAAGTEVFRANEDGTEATGTMTPIARYPEGTSHSEALEALGYTVSDEIG